MTDIFVGVALVELSEGDLYKDDYGIDEDTPFGRITLDDINRAAAEYMQPAVADQFFHTHPLMEYMRRREQVTERVNERRDAMLYFDAQPSQYAPAGVTYPAPNRLWTVREDPNDASYTLRDATGGYVRRITRQELVDDPQAYRLLRNAVRHHNGQLITGGHFDLGRPTLLREPYVYEGTGPYRATLEQHQVEHRDRQREQFLSVLRDPTGRGPSIASPEPALVRELTGGRVPLDRPRVEELPGDPGVPGVEEAGGVHGEIVWGLPEGLTPADTVTYQGIRRGTPGDDITR